MISLLTHPTNPRFNKANIPRQRGDTRLGRDGMLEYCNPMTGEYVPAVRLEAIRATILDDESPDEYTYPKSHGNHHGKGPLDFTSFLQKDRDVGTDRVNRPDILFQIYSNHPHAQKPTGYVMNHNRIVLDPFDHGIRDFPELPRALSSQLDGSDIEYYHRQNSAITDYDLIARMPNGYWEGKRGTRYHVGPPRTGTINQRAQRFRGKAACITWGNRGGSDVKTVNSNRTFRDLNTVEQKASENQNKGKVPNRIRNATKKIYIKQQEKDDTNATLEDEEAAAYEAQAEEEARLDLGGHVSAGSSNRGSMSGIGGTMHSVKTNNDPARTARKQPANTGGKARKLRHSTTMKRPGKAPRKGPTKFAVVDALAIASQVNNSQGRVAPGQAAPPLVHPLIHTGPRTIRM